MNKSYRAMQTSIIIAPKHPCFCTENIINTPQPLKIFFVIIIALALRTYIQIRIITIPINIAIRSPNIP